MKLLNIKSSPAMEGFQRLSVLDIERKPNLPQVNNKDTFINTSPKEKNAPDNKWRNIFTIATFGLTGLCIAHRNNLFNPIKRETISIIKNDKFIKEIREYVAKKLTNENFDKITKKYLENLSSNNKVSKDLSQEAANILKNPENLSDLYKKVSGNLRLNESDEGLEKSFSVALLDKLKIRIEKYLIRNKQNDLPYKNQYDNIVKDFFESNTDSPKAVDELFEDVVKERSLSTIETYLKDIVDSKHFNFS